MIHTIFFSISLIVAIGAQNLRLPEDATLDFKGLATKYGYKCEEHDVVTEDGYILRMFHIPGNKTQPVLLMHGLVDTSDSFILRGNTSMAATLARAGYDVWVGNNRGNRYSRRHKRLNPDSDKDFWDFSFHEIALYDISAMIDHVLQRTGQKKLSCIGHSQGNTVFYVLGALRPEYNNRIQLFIALAPISFLYHLRRPAKDIVETWPLVSELLSAMGREEIFGDATFERNLLKYLCSQKDGYELCVKRGAFPVAGYDEQELEPEFLLKLIGHYPEGTSRKGMTHLMQSGLRERFSQMDYGERLNRVVYNSTTPPDYDLSKVKMKVALVAAGNDGMCALEDVEALKRRLPNVVDYRVLPRKKMNHLDYIWGRRADKYLFPHIFSLLQKFGRQVEE